MNTFTHKVIFTLDLTEEGRKRYLSEINARLAAILKIAADKAVTDVFARLDDETPDAVEVRPIPALRSYRVDVEAGE